MQVRSLPALSFPRPQPRAILAGVLVPLRSGFDRLGEEAGKLAVSHINVPSIPLLGIYPNLQGLALQFALLMIIVIGFAYMRGSRRA